MEPTITKYNDNALQLEKEVPSQSNIEVLTKEQILANLATAVAQEATAKANKDHWIAMKALADQHGIKTSEEIQNELLEESLLEDE